MLWVCTSEISKVPRPRPEIWKIRGRFGSSSTTGKNAEAPLRVYLDRVPGDADGWNRLGMIHDFSGDREEAVRLWYKALAIDPSLEEAHKNLEVVGAEPPR